MEKETEPFILEEETEGMCSKRNCCTSTGWKICCRKAKCPCARPKQIKSVKNPSQLQNVRLQLPLRFSEKENNRPDNVVVTSKYTIWTFIPLATALQFRRAVNVFYLFQVILLVIGYYFPNVFLSPFTPWGTLSLLVFVIAVTMIFEGRDDIQRHESDRLTNNTKVLTISPDHDFTRVRTNWGNLRPGSFVVLKNRDLVPADMVVIETSSLNGTVYIETSGIDGETNLKLRQVAPEMRRFIRAPIDVTSISSSSPELLEPSTPEKATFKFRGVFEYEEPNVFLQFSGKFSPARLSMSGGALGDQGESDIPVGFDSLLLRGSEIRNTEWVLGVVVYAGNETKLMLSKKETPSKFARMDTVVNRMMYATMVEMLIMIIIAELVLFLDTENTADIWYFNYTNSLNIFTIPAWISYFFTFCILLANVVPISLYVCVELANFAQGIFLSNDLDMYDPITDTPAISRTQNLISEIGQVTHVFSDKTGTLTQNVMCLVGFSVNGVRYGIASEDYDSETSVTSVDPLVSNKGGSYSPLDPAGAPKPAPRKDFASKSEKVRYFFRSISKELDDAYNSSSGSRRKSLSGVERFLRFLAICHTVIIDHDEAGEIRYNAEGPDEEALVDASRLLGYKLVATDASRYIILDTRSGVEESIKILAVNGFSSDRKRMSMVIQTEEQENQGTATVLMKGADNVIFERLLVSSNEEKGSSSSATSTTTSYEEQENMNTKSLENDLHRFAELGLRTLVMCERTLSKIELDSYLEEYQIARATAGVARGPALAKCAEIIEKDCKLIGASAIEDALQDGVPEAIQILRDSGVNVWVLTGDKIETAISIGYSSNLLDRGMFQLILNQQTTDELVSNMEAALSVINRLLEEEYQDNQNQDIQSSSSPQHTPQQVYYGSSTLNEAGGGGGFTNILDSLRSPQNIALIVTGASMERILSTQKGNKQSEAMFVELSKLCSVVLACRVSPSQKALIVKAVTDNAKQEIPITLSIGDGANDVAMIQEANIGVGISGKEGRQAVNNSDFAIAQFRFIVPLLLVHGRYNYRRNSQMTLFICYTCQVLNFILFGYLFWSMVSGQQVYSNTYYITFFPWLCNSMTVGFAWFDKDIMKKTALVEPKTYIVGRENWDFDYISVLKMMFRSVLHSLIIWTSIFFISLSPENNSVDVLGAAIYIVTIWLILAWQFMSGRTWTWLMFLGVLILVVAFPILMYCLDYPTTGTNLIFTYAAVPGWSALFWSIAAIMIFERSYELVRLIYKPTPIDILTEIDSLPISGARDAFRAISQGRRILIPIEKIRDRFSQKTGQSLPDTTQRTGFNFEEVERIHS